MKKIRRTTMIESLKEMAEALTDLLRLDATRPVDTTWWRRHWDDAKLRATNALGALPVDLG